MRALETTLGVKLFARDGKRLLTTSAGREYLVIVRDALDRIAVGTDRLLQRQVSSVLAVSVSPDFGAKWLVHRLSRFSAAHPDIDLRVSSTTRQVNLVAERVDLAIRHGDGHWPELEAIRLFTEQLVPVCSPKLVAGSKSIKCASDLLKFPILRLENWSTWSRWFDAAGITAPAAHGPILNQASMLIDAAVDGQGIALARTTLAAWDLLNGRLIIPFNIPLALENTYWRVYPRVAMSEPKIPGFRDWLLAEAAEETQRLKGIVLTANTRRHLGRSGNKGKG